jgi:SAM-dependent MidA family methyltransferase
MTPLRQSLIQRIRATGPITLADYMTECLLHPEHGYYTNRDPLGAAGDFTTAPEISQMFGELVGLSLAQAWLDQGSPAPFNLCELGPGRGTLMADILRATIAVPGFTDAAQVHLVEASPVLRARQIETITHHTALVDIPTAPTFFVANEFFDALPIRQFQRSGNGWRERVIGLDGDTLTFGLTDLCYPDNLNARLAHTKDGDIVETSPASALVAAQIGDRIAQHGGTALIIDYGDWRSLGDTFQALKNHEPVDPLANPGTADLTAHVDFEALAIAARPANASPLTPQGVFLERLGLAARAQHLASKLSGQKLASHIAAHRRLAHPDEMGTLFKVMALYPTGATPPPGVDP